jgi:hypothetical protein
MDGGEIKSCNLKNPLLDKTERVLNEKRGHLDLFFVLLPLSAIVATESVYFSL